MRSQCETCKLKDLCREDKDTIVYACDDYKAEVK